jgi:hypothetical protein
MQLNWTRKKGDLSEIMSTLNKIKRYKFIDDGLDIEQKIIIYCIYFKKMFPEFLNSIMYFYVYNSLEYSEIKPYQKSKGVTIFDHTYKYHSKNLKNIFRLNGIQMKDLDISRFLIEIFDFNFIRLYVDEIQNISFYEEENDEEENDDISDLISSFDIIKNMISRYNERIIELTTFTMFTKEFLVFVTIKEKFRLKVLEYYKYKILAIDKSKTLEDVNIEFKKIFDKGKVVKSIENMDFIKIHKILNSTNEMDDFEMLDTKYSLGVSKVALVVFYKQLVELYDTILEFNDQKIKFIVFKYCFDKKFKFFQKFAQSLELKTEKSFFSYRMEDIERLEKITINESYKKMNGDQHIGELIFIFFKKMNEFFSKEKFYEDVGDIPINLSKEEDFSTANSLEKHSTLISSKYQSTISSLNEELPNLEFLKDFLTDINISLFKYFLICFIEYNNYYILQYLDSIRNYNTFDFYVGEMYNSFKSKLSQRIKNLRNDLDKDLINKESNINTMRLNFIGFSKFISLLKGLINFEIFNQSFVKIPDEYKIFYKNYRQNPENFFENNIFMEEIKICLEPVLNLVDYKTFTNTEEFNSYIKTPTPFYFFPTSKKKIQATNDIKKYFEILIRKVPFFYFQEFKKFNQGLNSDFEEIQSNLNGIFEKLKTIYIEQSIKDIFKLLENSLTTNNKIVFYFKRLFEKFRTKEIYKKIISKTFNLLFENTIEIDIADQFEMLKLNLSEKGSFETENNSLYCENFLTPDILIKNSSFSTLTFYENENSNLEKILKSLSKYYSQVEKLFVNDVIFLDFRLRIEKDFMSNISYENLQPSLYLPSQFSKNSKFEKYFKYFKMYMKSSYTKHVDLVPFNFLTDSEQTKISLKGSIFDFTKKKKEREKEEEEYDQEEEYQQEEEEENIEFDERKHDDDEKEKVQDEDFDEKEEDYESEIYLKYTEDENQENDMEIVSEDENTDQDEEKIVFSRQKKDTEMKEDFVEGLTEENRQKIEIEEIKRRYEIKKMEEKKEKRKKRLESLVKFYVEPSKDEITKNNKHLLFATYTLFDNAYLFNILIYSTVEELEFFKKKYESYISLNKRYPQKITKEEFAVENIDEELIKRRIRKDKEEKKKQDEEEEKIFSKIQNINTNENLYKREIKIIDVNKFKNSFFTKNIVCAKCGVKALDIIKKYEYISHRVNLQAILELNKKKMFDQISQMNLKEEYKKIILDRMKRELPSQLDPTSLLESEIGALSMRDFTAELFIDRSRDQKTDSDLFNKTETTDIYRCFNCGDQEISNKNLKSRLFFIPNVLIDGPGNPKDFTSIISNKFEVPKISKTDQQLLGENISKVDPYFLEKTIKTSRYVAKKFYNTKKIKKFTGKLFDFDKKNFYSCQQPIFLEKEIEELKDKIYSIFCKTNCSSQYKDFEKMFFTEQQTTLNQKCEGSLFLFDKETNNRICVKCGTINSKVKLIRESFMSYCGYCGGSEIKIIRNHKNDSEKQCKKCECYNTDVPLSISGISGRAEISQQSWSSSRAEIYKNLLDNQNIYSDFKKNVFCKNCLRNDLKISVRFNRTCKNCDGFNFMTTDKNIICIDCMNNLEEEVETIKRKYLYLSNEYYVKHDISILEKYVESLKKTLLIRNSFERNEMNFDQNEIRNLEKIFLGKGAISKLEFDNKKFQPKRFDPDFMSKEDLDLEVDPDLESLESREKIKFSMNVKKVKYDLDFVHDTMNTKFELYSFDKGLKQFQQKKKSLLKIPGISIPVKLNESGILETSFSSVKEQPKFELTSKFTEIPEEDIEISQQNYSLLDRDVSMRVESKKRDLDEEDLTEEQKLRRLAKSIDKSIPESMPKKYKKVIKDEFSFPKNSLSDFSVPRKKKIYVYDDSSHREYQELKPKKFTHLEKDKLKTMNINILENFLSDQKFSKDQKIEIKEEIDLRNIALIAEKREEEKKRLLELEKEKNNFDPLLIYIYTDNINTTKISALLRIYENILKNCNDIYKKYFLSIDEQLRYEISQEMKTLYEKNLELSERKKLFCQPSLKEKEELISLKLKNISDIELNTTSLKTLKLQISNEVFYNINMTVDVSYSCQNCAKAFPSILSKQNYYIDFFEQFQKQSEDLNFEKHIDNFRDILSVKLEKEKTDKYKWNISDEEYKYFVNPNNKNEEEKFKINSKAIVIPDSVTKTEKTSFVPNILVGYIGVLLLKHTRNNCIYCKDEGNNINVNELSFCVTYHEHNNMIYFDQNFWKNFQSCINKNRLSFVLVNIYCKTDQHANIFVYDNVTNTLERFDPNGKSDSSCYGVDSQDSSMTSSAGKSQIDIRFLQFFESGLVKKINYVEPTENSLLNIMTDRVDGDPLGFCLSWCFWYANLRIMNVNKDRDDLLNKFTIEYSKEHDKKNFIRSFSDSIENLKNFCVNRFGSTNLVDCVVFYSNIILKRSYI